MSKREGQPKIPENAPQAKKPKLEGDAFVNPQQFENVAPQQRPNSPVAGPSSAPSDPELQMSIHSGLIPMYRYFDPRSFPECSSQATSSFTDLVASTSSTNTTGSTTAEFGDSRTTSVEDMDVDSDLTASESSTSVDQRDNIHYQPQNERDQ